MSQPKPVRERNAPWSAKSAAASRLRPRSRTWQVDLRAADVMRRTLVVARPGDSLRSAIQKLVDAEVRHLPVIDEDGRLVGMLDDRDVRTTFGDPRAVLQRDEEGFLEELFVDDLMSREVVTEQPSTSVVVLAERFLDEPIGAVPIADREGRLLGIVSYVDVLAHFVGRRNAA